MTGNTTDAFTLLNPRLKGFLGKRLKWKKLNPIQEKAIPVILDKKDTLVLAPTASGKTEAVLIPIFNEIISDNLEPLSVIYVSPLKALINDMYDRIEDWSDYFSLTATKWHGDVPGSKKSAFIKNPTDFLLITPESLEVILMNKSMEDKKNIFNNLRYIIVDEIHYFAESDRGTQLNSLLNRINLYVDNPVIKVGLSATVGNPELVSRWLKPDEPAEIVSSSVSRSFQYKVLNGSEIEICKVLKKYVGKKILIFVRSRKDAELYYNLLKRELNIKNIYVHHSSIDKDRREESEDKFKNLKDGFMISTSTLELGIDVGNIDIVVQIRPPNNVSSFLQRIGRSGRRSKNQRSIIFYEDLVDILIALAEISLITDGHIEDIKIPEKPKDIYFHQILSSIFEHGKISKKELFHNLIDSYAFSKISKSEYIEILENMKEREFINENDGFLSLGYNFEKKFGKRNFLDFYAVFCPNFEYDIKEGGKNIGTLDSFFAISLKKGDKFILGGIPWKIMDIDYKRFVIKVNKDLSKKGEIPKWDADSGVIDYLISRRVYEILLNNFDRNLLRTFDDLSIELIEDYIQHAKYVGFKKDIIPVEIDLKSGKIYIFTFAGHKANALLSSIFNLEYEIYSVKDTAFYSSFKVKGNITFENISETINNVENTLSNPDIYSIIDEKTNKFVKNKFINFLPYDDNVKLKMELLYNSEDLINLVRENSVELVESTKFKVL